MKKQIKEAMVHSFSGIEFKDGKRAVRVSLEDGYSFVVGVDASFLTELCPGMEIDFGFETIKESISYTTSGAEFIFRTLVDVKIIDMRVVHICELGFCRKAQRVLDSAGIHTVSDVIGKSIKTLESLPGSSKGVAANIIKVMKTKGFYGKECRLENVKFQKVVSASKRP